MATTFKWDPFNDQVYTERDGGKDETVVADLIEGGAFEFFFFRKDNHSFTMDAHGHKLTLLPDYAEGVQTYISWPTYQAVVSTELLSRIHVKNGTLVVNAAAGYATDFNLGNGPSELLVENDSKLIIMAGQVTFIDAYSLITVRDTGVLSLTQSHQDPYLAVLRGNVIAQDKANIAFSFNKYRIFGGEKNANFNALALDEARIGFFGEANESGSVNSHQAEMFTLGRGSPEISFSRYDAASPLPFDFLNKTYPVGIFNFLTTEGSGTSGGKFRFVDWNVPSIFLLNALLQKKLISIDGEPQKYATFLQAKYEPGTNDFVITLR